MKRINMFFVLVIRHKRWLCVRRVFEDSCRRAQSLINAGFVLNIHRLAYTFLVIEN